MATIPMVYSCIYFAACSFCKGCSNVSDCNKSNLFLIAKLFKQRYQYPKILKAFPKFYHRHSLQFWFKNSSATGHIRASMLC